MQLLLKMLSADPDLTAPEGWLVGLEFNGRVNNIKVILSQSVYLTTLFLGQA